MNNTFKNFIIFATGSAVGSVVTWKLLKSKYERLAQEEIDSVKEVFARRAAENKAVEETAPAEPEKKVEEKEDDPVMRSYTQKLQDLGYSDYSDTNEDTEFVPSVAPYVVSPDEFGLAEGYDMVDYTYYADGVLVDEVDEIVEDIEGTVGTASLRRFGEYEPNVVHVRNDVLKIEYQILRDLSTYAEAMGQVDPYQTEDQ